jgi:dTDP-4-amino-4,6-dideoxygalactose transaminase
LTNWKIPLADIDIGQDEIAAVTDVLRSRWLSMGPLTTEFERDFAAYVGVKYAFAVTNCTAALHLAHLALGAGAGDTIVCPSLTFVATANAIRYTGATPVFADIAGEDNLNISPDDLDAKITTATKGICVVHYGGYPCDMDRIMHLARRYQLYVVEDVAHAPGAACWMSDGLSGQRVLKKCGSIGDIGCFSFFANKNMTTGEGGVLTTNRDDLAEKIKLLRSHGMTSLTWDRERGHSFSYDVTALGYNYRFDELRAAIGLVQLHKLDTNNQKRKEFVNVYRELLNNIESISCPFPNDNGLSSYHLFPIILGKDNMRENFMTFMKNKGIQTSIHYPSIHKFSYYRSLNQQVTVPITDGIEKRIVTLPLYPSMSREKIEYIIASIKDWVDSTP